MEFSRIYLNRLQELPAGHDTVVVIDTLRSFTTAAVALARGAKAIYPVEGITAANLLSTEIADAMTVGAIPGGDPAPGFDFGNSPAEMMLADVRGKNILMSTAAGVRGLRRFQPARNLYAASLVVARATADAIRASGAPDVCFVITGEWVDRDGDEDIACADYIEALLRNEKPNPELYARRVRDSDFGRRFSSGDWPHLPLGDLELAARPDLFGFAMQARREGPHLVIR